ncbi:hypothetical protein MRB53_020764 [Persea americana]|uniref:Uncharacterized protein n=1 Tax=Persea americana TaxID=3435 RepID=A0ACC2L265_PERAE|nr:hypothetical protein MRB53_020764 [Persea americana]
MSEGRGTDQAGLGTSNSVVRLVGARWAEGLISAEEMDEFKWGKMSDFSWVQVQVVQVGAGSGGAEGSCKCKCRWVLVQVVGGSWEMEMKKWPAAEEELAGRTECRRECKWLLAAGYLQVGWPAAAVAAGKEGNNGR